MPELERAEETLDDKNESRRIDLSTRAAAWLETKWPKPRICPICQTQKWTVGYTASISEWLPRDETEATVEVAYPLFPVVCGNCGYTVFFNAALAGIVDSRAKQLGEDESE